MPTVVFNRVKYIKHLRLLIGFVAALMFCINILPALAQRQMTADELRPVTQKLYSDSEIQRAEALQQLKEYGPRAKAALSVLNVALTRETNPDLRLAIRNTIEIITDEVDGMQTWRRAQEVNRLVTQLENGSRGVRRQALTVIGSYGVEAESALPILEKLKNEENDQFNRLMAEKAHQTITEAVKARDAEVAEKDEQPDDNLKITKAEQAEIDRHLLDLQEEASELKLKAIKGLRELKAKAHMTIPKLNELALIDPDPEVRQAAGVAVREIKQAKTAFDTREAREAALKTRLFALIATLDARDNQERMEAMAELGELGAEAEPALRALRTIRDHSFERVVVSRAAGDAVEKIETALLKKETKTAE